MECPKCGHKAIVAYKQEYRKQQGTPISEVRTYVCMDITCAHSFAYRNTYLEPRERLDAKKFIRNYTRRAENKNQEELFEDDDQ